MNSPLPILFSAMEPSGDALAAPLIAELKLREPDRPIFAIGGERMAEAGAELLEDPTEHAAMLAGASKQAWEHIKRIRRVRRWLAEHPIAALVPTDSPAANWGICKAVRKTQPRARIVHLAAPQLWAWAPWRIGKLRRLSDHVMCMLPFEPDWFGSRNMPASFVGHPLFAPDADDASTAEGELPEDGEPRLALLPGSRMSEVQANWPTMLEAIKRLRPAYPKMRIVIAASSASRAKLIRSLTPGGAVPHKAVMVVGQASAALDWADAALVVSGTATLHAVSRRTPMVVMFNASRLSWQLAGRWLIQTRTFTLPNLISESMEMDRIVTELVPHFGDVDAVIKALQPLLRDEAAREAQRQAFEVITRRFVETPYAVTAADTLIDQIGAVDEVAWA
ncbi:lipid-A-disaccharide synthase [Phycisphaerales bacterium AB-hyl4]|uniref:Lipid-A-disaccharide synthase n=1 Tax=Natronomicrosphaera hydrolytica TaxID=3242702 RepID=A0ABV4U174_9BACT